MKYKVRLIVLVAIALPLVAYAGEFGKIAFPNTTDGRLVLPVDFHTHTVFSDGFVWPTVRVDEAAREGLAGVAITDHLEWEPHQADIPNPNRNRSYEIAAQEARDLVKAGGPSVIVIRGTEITRPIPPGHLNAVFLADVNKLLVTPNYPVFSRDEDSDRFEARNGPKEWQSVHAALLDAHRQGAFIILNHPSGNFDNAGRLNEKNKQLIDEGLTQGIEVVNGFAYYEDAFNLALERNMAIIGSSDSHDTADHVREFSFRYSGFSPPTVETSHRTVTLVLARQADAESIRAAVFARSTVGLGSEQLFGREDDIKQILSSVLTAVSKPKVLYDGFPIVRISNGSSIPLRLRCVDSKLFLSSTDMISVPANGSIEIPLNSPPAGSSELMGLDVEVLSAFIAPRRHPIITIRIAR